jgi:hypothetical protein
MKNRRDRLSRAREISDQLWRLQQVRLAQAESAVEALRVAETASFQSLDHVDPRIVLPYVASLVRQRAEAEITLAQAQDKARECGRRMKLTEKLFKAADDAARQSENSVERGVAPTRDDISAR